MSDRAKLHPVTDKDDKLVGYSIWCEGCDEPHHIYTSYPGGQNWEFNGNLESPTFSPSLLVFGIPASGAYPGHPRCHSFVRNGQMEFLSDCEHKHAGLTVPLKPWSWEDWGNR